jgi:hypothetical protein
MEEKMENNTFIDGIGKIQVINGVVRLDMICLRNVEGDDSKNKTDTVPAGQLVLPLNGFLRMHDQMLAAVEQMVQKGLLKRQETVKAADAPVVVN